MKKLKFLMIKFCSRYSRLFWVYHQKNDKVTNNPPTRIYVNKIENRTTFRIQTGYYLELVMPETVKLLRNTKNKITKNKNDENVPHLEITEVLFSIVIMSMMIINKIQESFVHFFLINCLVNY